MNRIIEALDAALGLGMLGGDPAQPDYTPKQTARFRARRNYPKSGTGIRQGERVARQVRSAFGDPFAAFNARIERVAQRAKALT